MTHRRHLVVGLEQFGDRLGQHKHMQTGIERTLARMVERTRSLRASDTVVALPDDLKAALDRRTRNPPERDELIAAALRAERSPLQNGE